jgi:hypothetical protein
VLTVECGLWSEIRTWIEEETDSSSNPYQGHPCHIEIFLSTPSAQVPRSDDLDVTSSKKGKKIAAIEA